MKKLMLGNEAVARGLYEAGCSFVSSYPGTPSTEITEYAAKYAEIYAEWAPSEKVAMETAFGACVAGKRSFCGMKHVGVNVAADPLFTIAYTGVKDKREPTRATFFNVRLLRRRANDKCSAVFSRMFFGKINWFVILQYFLEHVLEIIDEKLNLLEKECSQIANISSKPQMELVQCALSEEEIRRLTEIVYKGKFMHVK